MQFRFQMPIKNQNFLFLLGASDFLFLLFIPVITIGGLLKDVYGLPPSRLSPFDITFFFFVIGIVNLCSDKVAHYIYNKSQEYLPRLRWYSLFFGWITVFRIILHLSNKLAPFDLFNAALISCIVGALCYPNRTWKKRLFSAFIFLMGLILFNYVTIYHAIKSWS